MSKLNYTEPCDTVEDDEEEILFEEHTDIPYKHYTSHILSFEDWVDLYDIELTNSADIQYKYTNYINSFN